MKKKFDPEEAQAFLHTQLNRDLEVCLTVRPEVDIPSDACTTPEVSMSVDWTDKSATEMLDAINDMTIKLQQDQEQRVLDAIVHGLKEQNIELHESVTLDTIREAIRRVNHIDNFVIRVPDPVFKDRHILYAVNFNEHSILASPTGVIAHAPKA